MLSSSGKKQASWTAHPPPPPPPCLLVVVVRSTHSLPTKPPWNLTCSSLTTAGLGSSTDTYWGEPCSSGGAYIYRQAFFNQHSYTCIVHHDIFVSTVYTFCYVVVHSFLVYVSSNRACFETSIRKGRKLETWGMRLPRTLCECVCVCAGIYSAMGCVIVVRVLAWSEFQHVSSLPSNINCLPNCFTSLLSTELTLQKFA